MQKNRIKILISIFIFSILMYPHFLMAQKNVNISDLRKIISLEVFETKRCLRKLPKEIRRYLKNNRIKFGKRYKKVFKTEYDAAYRIPKLIAISKDYCLINYAHTGRAFHEHTLVLKINNNKVYELISLYTPGFTEISNLKYYFSVDENIVYISSEY